METEPNLGDCLINTWKKTPKSINSATPLHTRRINTTLRIISRHKMWRIIFAFTTLLIVHDNIHIHFETNHFQAKPTTTSVLHNKQVFSRQLVSRCQSKWILQQTLQQALLNRLKPNDPYMGRTAPLTSKRCILYIYSTNIGTEYFKHALYSPFFFSSKCSLFHNANLFRSCIIHSLYTGCAKIKKKNSSGAKGLKTFNKECTSIFVSRTQTINYKLLLIEPSPLCWIQS